MKHNFLRRLSALALALIMAASLCVTPAWAAEGDGTTGGDGTTTDPTVPAEMTLSSRVIYLKDANDSYQLTINGASAGEKITFSRLANVTFTPSEIEVTDNNPIPVTVTASARVDKGRVTVTRSNSNGDSIGTTTCYVYCITSPVQGPQTFGPVTEGQTPLPTLTATVNDSDIASLLQDTDITFGSGDTSKATVTSARDSNNASRFVATINPLRALTAETVTITMYLQGKAIQSWELAINPKPGTIPVVAVGLRPSTLQMTVGETSAALTATVSPSNATDKTITWSSDDPGIATVADGKVTAVGAGSTTIKAVAGGVEGTCRVTVKEATSNLELKIADSILEIEAGKALPTTTINPVLTGENKDHVTIKWSSSNTSLVDFGGNTTMETTNSQSVTIRGKKASTSPVTITATATFYDANNKVTAAKTARCTVSVIDESSIRVTSLALSENSHTMPVDGTFTLSVKSFIPANAPAKTVEWSCVPASVAEVANGKVTAKSAGTAVITARVPYGGAYDFCELTVTPISETITLSGFNYDSNTPGTNKYTYTFRNSGNDYINVRANLGPTGAADPIHWVSKNPAVATVSNTTSAQAVVTAVGAGRTTITAVPMDPAGKDRVLESGPAEITVEVSGVTIVNDEASAITSLTLMEGQRRQIESRSWGAADNGDNSVEWNSSDPSVVTVNPKSSATTTLSARGKGTATISARKGSFIATCTVTVTEDTAGVISVSTTPGTAYQFSNLASSISSACQTKTGAGLSYITNLSVSSTDQGILHDQHHSSADTGAGVGIQDRYYAGTAPQGQRSLSDLSFVPRNDFSGVAEINYTAWSTNNKSVNGVIRVTVNGTGDVMYASGEGSPVTFQADDFNRYHANFKSVSFTPPLDSRGVLYYNYTSASQPGTKVTASDSYNRTGTPSVDRVTFVPAAGYSGTVTISYRGTDNGGRSFTGTVTINVSAASNAGSTADISYPLREDSWVTFTPADFNAASQRTLGEALSYVRFTPPPSSDGTLFYNYRGFSSFDSMVNDTTSYYYSGTPALSGVSFVPTTTTPSQVDVAYTGYTVKGNTFTGIIHIGQSSTTQPANDLRYSVVVGQTINLSASAINSACVAATGVSLSYIQFTQLPTVSQGTLRYTRGSSSTRYNVSTGTRFFYTGTSTTTELIGNVFFQAGTTVGTVTIPFTGYNTNGVSFTDEITIQVTPPTTTYSGTTASPLRLSASQISSAVSGALSGTLSYITFTSLPSTTAGHLYQGYSGVGTGTQVNTGTRYYASGTPSIDQISFVPRGRYNGQVTIGYTATNTSGQSTTGQVVFNISSTGNSSYFNDMYGHTWAGPSVDYLYQNNVTNGVTSTQFAPNQRINRCDFVLMLCRAFKLSGGSGYSFPDVPTDSYFASAVATAKQLGIVNGDDRGRFQPYGQVTRQDAMVMTYNALRAAGWSVGSASTSVLNQFPDGNSVSSYARTAVSSLVQMGAVTGDNGRLLPHNSITRAEAAVILHFVMTM